MSDGAAAVVIMSAKKAAELGAKPLARFVAYATSGWSARKMGIGPGLRDSESFENGGLTMDDIDIFELNEALRAKSGGHQSPRNEPG